MFCTSRKSGDAHWFVFGSTEVDFAGQNFIVQHFFKICETYTLSYRSKLNLLRKWQNLRKIGNARFRRLIAADGTETVYISSLCGRFLQRYKKPVPGSIFSARGACTAMAGTDDSDWLQDARMFAQYSGIRNPPGDLRLLLVPKQR